MLDALLGIERHLDLAIVGGGRAVREKLADPIGHQRDCRNIGYLGHALSTPPRPVGRQSVTAQMQLWLKKNPPPAGPTTAVFEWPDQQSTQARARIGMRRRGARQGVDL